MSKLCRFGILGTAGIARKNWKAIRLSGNATVTAVASRNRESAQRFIDECSAQVPQQETPSPFGAYEEMLASDTIDAVYIPLPTALRHQWVIRAAEAGKHVLGEKPAANNASEVQEMLDACRRHRVQYMDGVMFMHSGRLPLVRSLLEDANNVGQIRRIAAQFSFNGGEEFCRSNIRAHSGLEPYGCLGDLGWYCVRLFLWVMKGQMPLEVSGRILTKLQGEGSPASVPGEFAGELRFPGGISASFYCSFLTAHQEWVHISGTNGYLRIDDFVLPYRGSEVAALVGRDLFTQDNCVFHMEQHLQRFAVREYDAGDISAQEVRMIQTFSDLVNSGSPATEWPQWTLKTQRVLDLCMESALQDGETIKIG